MRMDSNPKTSWASRGGSRLALQDDGWYLRSAIVWHKPNPMPESVRDRPTSAYEMVFLFSKQPRYFIRCGGDSGSAISTLAQWQVPERREGSWRA